MKCIEFDELVENFNCDSTTIEYLKKVAFKSGGAESLFVDLDTISSDCPQRDYLLEKWQEFTSESIKNIENGDIIEHDIEDRFCERFNKLEDTLQQLSHTMISDKAQIASLANELIDMKHMVKEQKRVYSDFVELSQKMDQSVGDLIEKTCRIEGYFASPFRDKLLYIIIFLLLVLDIWKSFL